MIQALAATLLVAHGLIHLIGFVVPWGIAEVEGFPNRTTVLGGAIALGDAGARLVGAGWLALAIGFVVAGAGASRAESRALAATAGLALASLVVCALGLPEAAAGFAVNVGILMVLGWVVVSRGSAVGAPG